MPSGCNAIAVTKSLLVAGVAPLLMAVMSLPPVPNVVSSAPAAVVRTAQKSSWPLTAQCPARINLPSGCSVIAVTKSLPAPTEVTSVPLVPKLASSVPFALYRSVQKSIVLPLTHCAAMSSFPSGCNATALASELPLPTTVMSFPPLPKLASSVPFIS